MIGPGCFVLDWLNEEGSTSSVKEATLYLGLGYFGLFAAGSTFPTSVLLVSINHGIVSI